MKLAELGLKTKPATKYVENGYISFSTQNKNLFHVIHQVEEFYSGGFGGQMLRRKLKEFN